MGKGNSAAHSLVSQTWTKLGRLLPTLVQLIRDVGKAEKISLEVVFSQGWTFSAAE